MSSIGREFYCLSKGEVCVINEIFKSVEKDVDYYGSQFYELLFDNHPYYLKYFQEGKTHEFQTDFTPIMRTKFCLTCSTMASLFIDYKKKPKSRENLLGYLAMVHRDMRLGENDLKNFMIVIMEIFINNFPKLMTADCSLSFMKYSESIVNRIYFLMKKQPTDFLSFSENKFSSINSEIDLTNLCFTSSQCIRWFNPKSNLIYGRSPEYWNLRRRHWIVQRALWATNDDREISSDSFKTEDFLAKNSIVTISPFSINENSSSDHDRTERLNRGGNRRVSIHNSAARERRRTILWREIKNWGKFRSSEIRRFVVPNQDEINEVNNVRESCFSSENGNFRSSFIKKLGESEGGKKNRGTSISNNVSNYRYYDNMDKNRTESIKNSFNTDEITENLILIEAKNQTSGDEKPTGRISGKSNKRVSISNPRWSKSEESDK